jgi:hypothetical protein
LKAPATLTLTCDCGLRAGDGKFNFNFHPRRRPWKITEIRGRRKALPGAAERARMGGRDGIFDPARPVR